MTYKITENVLMDKCPKMTEKQITNTGYGNQAGFKQERH